MTIHNWNNKFSSLRVDPETAVCAFASSRFRAFSEYKQTFLAPRKAAFS